ncbi:hypothetical protein N181_19600 [Sinorhizobium fredii USDA 205]|uniref:DUF262 domain-containing protein n=1 Tax=Rhizobium fredii TaxID=380 RepID=A0A844AE97_RHIFR|nr:DUF262 domain-containing protein [Sinorhizobium fredii]KSV87134.1 hypothetical protein N181_19600 [Sinorhizobium fredii USDA 205]MQX10175.1 DUF262 domain-containing protein [Sinorhizobium fredii]GEC32160.1 hypothetical protein EFR01_23310 [Sinorhizobium fredii]GLS07380.1 hypothetical protein GCM10007864_10070 [Sinorhizobium fredii]
MKPYTRSIIELFDGKRRYLIPLYQRQYAWKAKPQLELLWEDIERATERLKTDRASVSPHFMGAIVISQVKTYGKEVQAFEIIDGQQRLTTFQLLLTALRDVATKFESTYADEVSKYLLNSGMMENPLVERYKLWPSLLDRRAFVSLVDANADLDKIADKPLDEDGFVRLAIAAHAYFREKIEAHVSPDSDFDEHAMDILFEALKDGLAVVSIELEGGDDPQTIFETLNSRGVDLSAGDLMRNFIFQRAKGMGQKASSLIVDELYKKHWLPLDRAFWTQSASRGRQTSSRLDWMLTDHLSMHLADIVSVETLFEAYRRWILSIRPFEDVTEELSSITATAEVERKLFEQSKNDPLGRFGIFADAFDVSTAMPLVIYLATEADIGDRLPEALHALESYILRRDICGLTTKAYNRLFVGLVDRIRKAKGDKVEALVETLSSRESDIDRWPSDTEWRHAWLGRDQYKGQRQPRLRYLFEIIEQRKRTKLNENIEIKSALSIEHIMPRGWTDNWPIAGYENAADDDTEYLLRSAERDGAVNKLGNLTLLTQSLNATVSNGPFSIKMPAVRSHSSLALNRELNGFDTWNEETIKLRGAALFEVARQVWVSPKNLTEVAAATASNITVTGPVRLPVVCEVSGK